MLVVYNADELRHFESSFPYYKGNNLFRSICESAFWEETAYKIANLCEYFMQPWIVSEKLKNIF